MKDVSRELAILRTVLGPDERFEVSSQERGWVNGAGGVTDTVTSTIRATPSGVELEVSTDFEMGADPIPLRTLRLPPSMDRGPIVEALTAARLWVVG